MDLLIICLHYIHFGVELEFWSEHVSIIHI